jgi:hypothetical protein
MQSYTVHEPPGGPADRVERAERLVFVKDGFSFVAMLFTPFWMLANRLWLALLVYIVALVGLELVVWASGMGQQAAGWIMVALHVLVGFESDAIRRWSLARRGYKLIGSVTGRSWDECERRFLTAWLAAQPFVAPKALEGQPGWGSRGTEGRLSPLALGPGR